VFLGGSHWDSTGKPLLLVDPNCVLTEQLPGSDILWMFSCGGCGGQSNSANHNSPLLCTGRRFTNQPTNSKGQTNLHFEEDSELIDPQATNHCNCLANSQHHLLQCPCESPHLRNWQQPPLHMTFCVWLFLFGDHVSSFSASPPTACMAKSVIGI